MDWHPVISVQRQTSDNDFCHLSISNVRFAFWGIFSKTGKTRVSHRVKMMTRWPGRERSPKWPIDPVTQWPSSMSGAWALARRRYEKSMVLVHQSDCSAKYNRQTSSMAAFAQQKRVSSHTYWRIRKWRSNEMVGPTEPCTPIYLQATTHSPNDYLYSPVSMRTGRPPSNEKY